MKILMANFWHNSCKTFLNFALLFDSKGPPVFVFTTFVRVSSLIDGDHPGYMHLENMKITQVIIQISFSFLVEAEKIERMDFFFFLTMSDCCGREGGAGQYILIFFLFSKFYLIWAKYFFSISSSGRKLYIFVIYRSMAT